MAKKGELLIYGLRSTLALWDKRKQDIIRVYCSKDRVPQIKGMLKFCADTKKAYHLVTDAELEKITSSTHHEGLAILVKEKAPFSEEKFLSLCQKNKVSGPLVFIDGVANPHNIGAMTRSMAHFGVRYILGSKKEMPQLSASWVRLSEGGIESVTPIWVEDKLDFLKKMKKMGYTLLGLSSHAKNSIYRTKLPAKTIFIMGNEVRGLSRDVEGILSDVSIIPGSGAVESLNVSVALGVCLSEFVRRIE